MARHRDGRPRHQQIAADVRALIMSGDLPAGSQLPSTQQLVQRYNSANATIQRALAILKEEGFLSSHVGKGVFVRSRQPLVVKAAAYIEPSPKGFSYQLLEVAEANPPTEAREALGLQGDATAILRRRLLLHDGEPVELSWSYYPTDIAHGTPLANARRIVGGTPKLLAELGYPKRRMTDRLSVRLATSDEVQELRLPPGVPVIRQVRVIFTDDNRPVEVDILIKGGHHYELVYESQ